MNLTPLKPHGKFKPLFTKTLKDPQELMKQGVLKDINFDLKGKHKNETQIEEPEQIAAVAVKLISNKVKKLDKEMQFKRDSAIIPLSEFGTKAGGKNQEDSVSKSSQQPGNPEEELKHISKEKQQRDEILKKMPAPVNILSSISSDGKNMKSENIDSEGGKVSKHRENSNSNRENKTSDDRTDAKNLSQANKEKENSVVLSEIGISIGEGEKDPSEINQKLKAKLKSKQDELDKTEFEFAKAKADYIKIMRELVRFPHDFKTKYSLKSRLEQVKSA